MNSVESTTRMSRRTLRQVLGLLFLTAYSVLAHAAIASGLPLLAALAWICLAALVGLAMSGWTGLAAGALLAAAPLVADVYALLRFPPVIFNLMLAVWFGRSLLPGEEPVIGWFARLEHGEDLSKAFSGYTRCLTILWTVFFIASAVLAAALALFADSHAWSVFANGIDYLLVAVLFVGEYVYRRLRYRNHKHASLAYHIRSVFAAGRLTPRRSAHR